jgi:hypothetical protein
MKTWREHEELVEARGAEYRAGTMTDEQFRAYLFAMRYRGEDIRHRMMDFAPAPTPMNFEERRLNASRDWLRSYHEQN